MLATILAILGSLVPMILQNTGVIGASTTTLINHLLAPVVTLIQNLMAGTSKTQDALAVLGAMSGVVAVLKANTNLPASVLTELGDIDADIDKALAAYVTAEGGLNLTVYQPIAPVS